MKSYHQFRTLFFAGFVVASPEQSDRQTTNRSRANPHYDINELKKKLQRQDQQENQSPTSSKAPKDSSLQSLVEDLFEPYGSIEYFHFDDQNGAGVVQYKNGKSGENCYLMSHLLPFTVTTKITPATLTSTSSPSAISSKNRNKNREQRNGDEGQNDDDDDESRASSVSQPPISFSLVCLEFACLLPFSAESRRLFSTSIQAWTCSRKNLHQLPFLPPVGQEEEEQQQEWKSHLEFMRTQRDRKKLYFKNLSWLRHELLVEEDDGNSDGNSAAGSRKMKLSADAASELQSHIEGHVMTLLFTPPVSSSVAKNDDTNKIDNLEPQLFDSLQHSEFWNFVLVPSCLDKIVSQLCEIDVDKVGISNYTSSPDSSPVTSPTTKKSHKGDVSATPLNSESQSEGKKMLEAGQSERDRDAHQRDKRTQLMLSMIHSSISILDIWLAIYHTFYSGDRARQLHSSVVAVLEHKLMASSSSSSSNSTSTLTSSSSSSGYSFRHPAWPSFALSNLSEESRVQSVLKNGYSPAINRRTNFAKLYSGKTLPIHLGLRQWPGGEGDDVGSAFRAVLAMLVAVRPFYLDQSFRHMWTHLFCCASFENIESNNNNNNNNNNSNNNKHNTTASENISSFSILSQLQQSDAKIKKQFLSVSSKQEALIEGAWHLLYRASWKMETAFSLIVSYLSIVKTKEHNNKKQRKVQQGTEETIRDGVPSNEETSFVEKLQQKQQGQQHADNEQPSLWPLLRPIDKLEVDWKQGRGVLCDESMVYRRLFDGDEEFALIKKEDEKSRGQGLTVGEQENFLWVNVLLPLASFILVYVFGQNPAVLHSRYYRRKFFDSLMSFVPPILTMMGFTVVIFYLLKLGYVEDFWNSVQVF